MRLFLTLPWQLLDAIGTIPFFGKGGREGRSCFFHGAYVADFPVYGGVVVPKSLRGLS